jgi:hypothetical protein
MMVAGIIIQQAYMLTAVAEEALVRLEQTQ